MKDNTNRRLAQTRLSHDRFSRLIASMAVGLSSVNAEKEEVEELFRDVNRLTLALLTGLSLSQAAENAGHRVADLMISEARAIFGDEAAKQLIDRFNSKVGEGA